MTTRGGGIAKRIKRSFKKLKKSLRRKTGRARPSDYINTSQLKNSDPLIVHNSNIFGPGMNVQTMRSDSDLRKMKSMRFKPRKSKKSRSKKNPSLNDRLLSKTASSSMGPYKNLPVQGSYNPFEGFTLGKKKRSRRSRKTKVTKKTKVARRTKARKTKARRTSRRSKTRR